MKKIPLLTLFSLITMLGIYCMSSIIRSGVPGSVFDILQRDFATSAGVISALGICFTVIYAMDMLLIGPLTDKYGGIRVLTAGVSMLLLGSILFICSKNVPLLIASRLVTGFGCGFIYLSVVKEITRIFPGKYFAMVMGLVYLMTYTGSILSTTPLVYFCENYSWRQTFGGITVIIAVFFTGFLICFTKTDRPAIRQIPISLKTYLAVFKNRACMKLYYCMACNMAIFFFVQGVIGKKFLEDVTKCTSGQAANVILICSAITLTEMCLIGTVSFAIGNRRKPFLVSSAVFQLASCLMLSCGIMFNGPFWLFAAAFFIMAAGYGFSGIFTALVKEYNPEENTALTVGAGNFFGNICIAFFSFLAGLLLDLFRAEASIQASGVIHYPPKAYLFLWFIILLMVLPMLYLCWKAKESFGRNISKEL
ncbi:MAG: MFS transporter [Lentisphaeria bacterium]|nr:MFS transporter [Lentisphaeria bacterium]